MPSQPPFTPNMPPVVVRQLGLVEYQAAFDAMRDFTASRSAGSADEIWLLQHPPTYTQGRNGKAEHLLRATDIPLVQIDRGGQLTYHGPGQLIAYLLLDLRRLGIGVRQLVTAMEQAVIELLADYGIAASSRADAPGVYVDGAKVAALGLRVTRGCSYHGLSLNVDMELEPFSNINPCGYPGLAVTDLRRLGIDTTLEQIGGQLSEKLQQLLHTP
jgi:lipoyl(octanoyl) transferase